MRSQARVSLVFVGLLCAASIGCGRGTATGGGGASAAGADTVTIDGVSHAVRDLRFELHGQGADAYYQVHGQSAAAGSCSDWLDPRIFLYGDTGPVSSLADLLGKSFSIEFSGDGDDANFCLAGTTAYYAAQSGATILIENVDGGTLTLRLDGTFDRWDAETGQKGEPARISAHWVMPATVEVL